MTTLLNTLYITTPDAYLRLEGETVCVMIGKKKQIQVPLHHLGAIVCFGAASLSPALMGRCAADGRSLVWLSRSGRFHARLEGPTNRNVLLRQAQYRASEDPAMTLDLARRFIAGKLRNSRHALLRGARETDKQQDRDDLSDGSRQLASALRQLPDAKDLDQIRGREGQGARAYFKAFSRLIRPKLRQEFPFNGRTRRPPTDPLNAMVSFIYALLLADCRSALEGVGLDPQLGFLHAPRPGRQSLALDLMEEFRAPLGDRLAVSLVNRGQIKAKDFDARDGGAVLMNEKGRKSVIAAYQKRKQETLIHPLLEQQTPIGLIPHLQARLLARHLRGDLAEYVPFLQH
jgi:CRISPR-associated protein Cas1